MLPHLAWLFSELQKWDFVSCLSDFQVGPLVWDQSFCCVILVTPSWLTVMGVGIWRYCNEEMSNKYKFKMLNLIFTSHKIFRDPHSVLSFLISSQSCLLADLLSLSKLTQIFYKHKQNCCQMHNRQAKSMLLPLASMGITRGLGIN